MARKKDASKTKSRRKAGLQTGIVGLTLSLAGAACAESGTANASTAPTDQVRGLHVDEVFDTTMSSFYVQDKENPGGVRTEGEVKTAWWNCRCWRCRCWRCRCRCRCGCA